MSYLCQRYQIFQILTIVFGLCVQILFSVVYYIFVFCVTGMYYSYFLNLMFLGSGKATCCLSINSFTFVSICMFCKLLFF